MLGHAGGSRQFQAAGAQPGKTASNGVALEMLHDRDTVDQEFERY